MSQTGRDLDIRLASIAICTLISFFALALAGCGSSAQAECEPTELTKATGASDPIDEASAKAAWQLSAHADTYVEDTAGQNQTCASCHARANWRPAPADWPSSWPSVPTDFMAGERGIPPEEWQHVSCSVCHPRGDSGDYQKVAWLENPFTLNYQQLDANWVVCENCHAGSGTVDHTPVTVSGVHSGMNCLDCHDPHTAAASCTQAGCHLNFEGACVPVIEHSKPHQAAACQACHASGEYLVKWDQGRELWNLAQTNEAGQLQRAGFISPHAISLETRCERCHTPGELPWME